MTFILPGVGKSPDVEVIATELDGTIEFTVTVLETGGGTTDLRGLFFDLANYTRLEGLEATGDDVTGQGTGDVVNLGRGVNMNGAANPFDAAVALGTPGTGKDNIQTTSIVLTNSDGNLTLDDIANVEFGVHLTSVGDSDGPRGGAKLVATSPEAPAPISEPPAASKSAELAEIASLEPNPVLPSDITLVIEKVGTIPGGDGETNFQSPVAIKQSIYGINQNEGKIYRVNADGDGNPRLIFDAETDAPEGLLIDDREGIANMVGGNANKVYVAFTSDTLPEGADDLFSVMRLPEFEQPGIVPQDDIFLGNPFVPKFVDDLYRLEASDLEGFPIFIPKDVGIKYQIIYEYDLAGNKLANPEPIAAFEVQSSVTGHHGTGMEFTPDGKILWATGDNLPFGLNGRTGAQLEDELPSKLFIIDPDTGSVELAAKGLRNVQHLEIADYGGEDYLAFADIGGVTSEEVNIVRLDDIMDTSEIENFGWGVAEDGLSREGTFYVGGDFDPDNPLENGIAGLLGTQPPATGVAPTPEAGFIQPFAQYGRVGPGEFVASSGPVISEESFGDELTMVFGDLNLGTLFGTTDPFDMIDADVFVLNLVDENGVETTINDLAGDGTDPARADPRFFTFADGTAGVFLETTGDYYRLTEQSFYDDIA
ncbi:hypothetical protein AB1E33_25115 [Ruegeria sp. 2012CJ15-1]